MARDDLKRHPDHTTEQIPEADDRRGDPSDTGDPSNPQGRFWRPEDRHRGERLLRTPIGWINGRSENSDDVPAGPRELP